MNPIRTGLVGFGLAGAHLQAPLIAADAAFDLCVIATSRRSEAAARFPAVAVTTPETLIGNPAIELVAIASPNASHAPLARLALEAGKHVVVDKPFVIDLAEGRELERLAKARGLVLAVYHNRRWDDDFLAARQLLAEGRLGEIRFAALAWDRHRPEVRERWRDDPEAGAAFLPILAPTWLTRRCSCSARRSGSARACLRSARARGSTISLRLGWITGCCR